jgi:hypothetical protein
MASEADSPSLCEQLCPDQYSLQMLMWKDEFKPNEDMTWTEEFILHRDDLATVEARDNTSRKLSQFLGRYRIRPMPTTNNKKKGTGPRAGTRITLTGEKLRIRSSS